MIKIPVKTRDFLFILDHIKHILMTGFCVRRRKSYYKAGFLSVFILSISLTTISQPVITSFSPTSGPVGTAVTISGSNFSSTPANNIVYFGAVKASVTAAAATSLTVTVPAGATHEPITVTVNNLTAYSSRPFTVTFSGGALSSASFTIELLLDNVTGIETNDLASGDFDGDGKNDIAVIDQINGFMAVYKNNSTVATTAFAPRINFIAGAQPRAIASGDFDGDGKLDIVVANTNDNTVSVYRNTSTTGVISFAVKVDFATDVQPLDVAVADFDGDGKPDIAIADGSLLPSNVSILRNTGTGTIAFAPRTDIAILLAVSNLAVGDLNGDNKPDIGALSIAGNLMIVLTNNSTPGTISFPTITNYATGTAPGGLMIGDIDGDNKHDIAYANFFDQSLFVYRNTSSGSTITLGTPQNISLPGADRVALADADGDGRPEIIVQTFSPSGFSVLKNNSNPGAITLGSAIAYQATCSDGVLIGDWNNDGKCDVALGCGIFRVGIWKNKTTEPQITSFSPASAGPGATVTITGVNLTGVTAVTFGGTAASSFTVVNSTTITAVVGPGASGAVTVTAPHGTGTKDGFTFVPLPTITSFTPTTGITGSTITITGTNFTTATAVSFGGVAAASFTVVNSTTITAVVGAGTSGNVAVTTIGGTASLPGFTYIPTPDVISFTPTTGTIGTTVTISGSNFTGVTDVRFGGIPPASFTVANNTTITATVLGGSSGHVRVTGPGGSDSLDGFVFVSPPAPVITSFSPLSGTTGTVVTITGNNFHTTAAQNFVYFGSVRATVSAASATSLTVTVPPGAISQPLSVTTNFLTAYSSRSFIVTFPGGGDISNGSFEGPLSFTTNNGPIDICVNDFDGDGKNDLAVANSGSFNLSVLRNTTSGGAISFAPKVDYFAGLGQWNIVSAEIDGDGKQDIVIINNSLRTVSVLKNLSVPGTIDFAAGANYSLTIEPTGLITTDLNSDGKPDIVICSNAGVSVVRNTSVVNNISYAPRIDFTGGLGNNAIASSDVDGDEKPDIVFVSGLKDSVYVMRNTSSGTAITFEPMVRFATRIDNPFLFGPTDVIIKDLDNDGKPEIAIANTSASTSISVLRNLSTPGFISFAARTDFMTGTIQPFQMTAEDLDGDGKLDIPFSHESPPRTVSVIRNTGSVGNVSFAGHVNFTDNTNGQLAGMCAADLDADGRSEIITTCGNGSPFNLVYVYRNKTNGPHITSFTPTNGISGTVVTITGSNFTGATAVSFGGVAASSFTVVNATTITAIVATGASGSVSVTTPSGTTSAPGFLYGLLPAITSFSPTSGATGTLVTITGTNLTGATAVSFGGVFTGTFTVVNSTTITASVWIGATGSVAVTTPGGTASLPGFTYIPPAPVINSFAPLTGSTGTVVTISGTNFTGATAVSFGGTPAASFIVNGPSLISATVGSGSTGLVSVTTPGGTGTRAGFTYTLPSPTITSFTPLSAATGTTVTITGTNFTGATTVSFGGTAAQSFTVVNATTITAVVGTGASGNVSVTTPGGTATSNGFTFVAPPTITSFTPVTAPTGATITITGTNFTGATIVTFGGIPAQSFIVNSATSISAVVGAGASGNVSVTTPGGTGTLSGFTYTTVTSTGGSGSVNSPELTVSPNPASGDIFLKHPTSPAFHATIQIFDALGRPVIESTPVRNASLTQLNVSRLNSGVYFIRWTAGNRILTRIFMKQ